MDEIIIDEKRYISSKQAAKITGYAKDYIGQLCREGRVTARLVGRSWYVLESAIQDHRFGDKNDTDTCAISEERDIKIQASNWEPAQYESTAVDTFPKIDDVEYRENGDEPGIEHKDIHDSWREWFDHVGGMDASPVATVREESSLEEIKGSYQEGSRENTGIKEEESEIYEESIPLNILPAELLPRPILDGELRKSEQRYQQKNSRRSLYRYVQLASVMLAVIALTLAVIGSGYLDSSVITHKRASFITGAVIYSR